MQALSHRRQRVASSVALSGIPGRKGGQGHLRPSWPWNNLLNSERASPGGERIDRLQPANSGQAGGSARRTMVTLPDYGHGGLKGGVAPACPGVHAARGPTNRLRSPRNHAATPTQLDVHPCHARNGPTIALATGETESIGPRGAEPNPSAGAPPARGSAPVTSTEALPRPWF